MDKVYFAHKWMGITASICAALHQQIKINTPGQQVMQSLCALSIQVAQISFYALLVLVLISFFKRLPRLPFEIPDGIWRLSHCALGLVMRIPAVWGFSAIAPPTSPKRGWKKFGPEAFIVGTMGKGLKLNGKPLAAGSIRRV